MLQLCASTVADTHAIAAAIAGLSRSGDLVVLAGEMGAGKTAFALRVAAELLADQGVRTGAKARKGRSLAGRYELTVYTPADKLIHAEIGASMRAAPSQKCASAVNRFV